MSVSSNLVFNFTKKEQIEAAKKYEGRLTGRGQGYSIQELGSEYMEYSELTLEFNDCFWCDDFVNHSRELSKFVAQRVPNAKFTVSGNFVDERCSEGDISAYLSYDGEDILTTSYTYGDDSGYGYGYDEESDVTTENETISISKLPKKDNSEWGLE